MASSLKRTGSATSSLPKYAAHARYVCWACCSTWICWLIAFAVSVAKFWLARDVLCTAMKGNMKDKEKKKKKERKGDKKWLQGILFACKMGQEQTNIADSSSSCQKGNMQRYKISSFSIVPDFWPSLSSTQLQPSRLVSHRRFLKLLLLSYQLSLASRYIAFPTTITTNTAYHFYMIHQLATSCSVIVCKISSILAAPGRWGRKYRVIHNEKYIWQRKNFFKKIERGRNKR